MASFSVGQTIGSGRYRLDAALARGGMGAVYRATDVRLGRTIAVKVLLSDLATDVTELARFEREAIAAARLHHPAIVQVLDVGREAGVPFLVMEHVQGRTISAALGQEGKLAWARAADVAEQALFALEVAHHAGITHRDIKPGNIMLVPTGGREMVKLLDFGIAQLKTGTAFTRLTQTGAILGTPAFMAPEQASGETGDARTDVYAMGVVLWCMLTGRKPFAGSDIADTITKVLTEVPVRADRLDPSVPAPLATLCDVALQKRPADRFPSAAAFANALVELRQGAPSRPLPAAPAVADPLAPPTQATAGPTAPLAPPTSSHAHAAPTSHAAPSASSYAPPASPTLPPSLPPPGSPSPPAAYVPPPPAPASPVSARWTTPQLVAVVLAFAMLSGLVTCLGTAYVIRGWARQATPFSPGLPSMPSLGGSSVCERAVHCCEVTTGGNAGCAQIRAYETMGETGEGYCRQSLGLYEQSATVQGRSCD